jgi:hypothetical protein
LKQKQKPSEKKQKPYREERMEANFNACGKETMACQEMTEANPEKMEERVDSKELNPEMRQSEVEHWEVLMEDAVLKLVGGHVLL